MNSVRSQQTQALHGLEVGSTAFPATTAHAGAVGGAKQCFLTLPSEMFTRWGPASAPQSFWGRLTKRSFQESDGMAEWGKINLDLR